MRRLLQQSLDLWQQQLVEWPLAAKFYKSLELVQTREFDMGNFNVVVQYNPARAVSTVASTDPDSIAKRPCFLCASNRPVEQKGIDAGRFTILVNPYPIFNQHFTIAYNDHQPQSIIPFFEDFLVFMRELAGLVVFYNGSRCGASAPDHLHFQAGNSGLFPLINEFFNQDTPFPCLEEVKEGKLINYKGAGRKVLVIEATTLNAANRLFEKLVHSLPSLDEQEPMMNVLGLYQNYKWYIFVIPRIAFRPLEFYAAEPGKLLISPAAVEMAGILITPVEEHFKRITKENIRSIYNQLSPEYE